jgi:tetratricopeptide (TPR) repeat protein
MYWVKEIETVFPDGRSRKYTYLLCNSFEEFIEDTAGVIGAPCVWAAQTGTMTRAAAREKAKEESKPLDFKRNTHLSPNVRSAMKALRAVVSAAVSSGLYGMGDEKGSLEARKLVINKRVGKKFHTATVYIPGYESIFDGTINKNVPETGEMNPDYAHAYGDIGMAYYVNHDYNRAIECLSTAIKIAPDCAIAYYNRGVSYFLINDLDNATKDVTHYLTIDPSNAMAQKLLQRITRAT